MPNVELSPQQSAFLETYLAAGIPDGPSVDELRAEIDYSNLNPADIWIEAMSEVDASLGALRSQLAGDPDPNMDRIAKLGLIGVTGGNNRALMGAFVTFSSATGEDKVKAAQDLLRIIGQVEEFVKTDDIITLLEEFPGGTPAKIRVPLVTALGQIRKIVAI